MAHELTWYTDGLVLRLDLKGQVLPDEMKQIDAQIRRTLDKNQPKLLLVINASLLAAEYLTVNDLRRTQQYIDHPHLDGIVVIANNKLSRLITMLVYGASQAGFVQFENFERAQAYIHLRGFSESSTPVNSMH